MHSDSTMQQLMCTEINLICPYSTENQKIKPINTSLPNQKILSQIRYFRCFDKYIS